MKCHNCFYEWIWKGKTKDPFYVTCPRCRFKVNVKKQKPNLKQGLKNLSGF